MRECVVDGALVLVVDSLEVDAGELMAAAAARVADVASSTVIIHRSCRHCGSSDHGQPLAFLDGSEKELCSVSFSRTAGYSLAAAQTRATIGVDIESIARVSAHPVDDVLLSPEERQWTLTLRDDDRARQLTRLWIAKEAVLKSTGIGLRADLSSMHVRLTDETGELFDWPSELEFVSSPRITMFGLSDDVVGALAVAGA